MRTGLSMMPLLVLAACGGGGSGGDVSVPDRFIGIWGADCTAPFVSFAAGTIHVYPDDATYPLTAATLAGTDLAVGYAAKAGAVTETYAVEGDTLRLDHGTYAGQDATWHKAPMRKCG